MTCQSSGGKSTSQEEEQEQADGGRDKDPPRALLTLLSPLPKRLTAFRAPRLPSSLAARLAVSRVSSWLTLAAALEAPEAAVPAEAAPAAVPAAAAPAFAAPAVTATAAVVLTGSATGPCSVLIPDRERTVRTTEQR